ncbi:MAG: hypothetical protein OQK77_03440 [Psychromonas sp.]|nr:hypothetical protein [Psychromonas sp.]
MSKFKTVKLLAVSLLSASAAQAASADLSPLPGDAPAISVNGAADAEQQGGNWVDFSDPTAVYSKVAMATGNEGVNVSAALGGYLGGLFEHKLTIEGMHDMDYYNINYMAFNTHNDTGFLLNSTWNIGYDEISAGVVKKVAFKENNDIKVYPAMKLGEMWDSSIPNTTFVELEAAVRYTINRSAWVGVTPNYRYALNGLDIKDLDATVDAGYQLADEIAISAHFNNDEEVWAEFTFAF